MSAPGGVSAPNLQGGCVCSKFFWGGVCSKFSGGGGWGVSAPNFQGGCLLPGGVPPIFGIRSPFGRYASYWNAFLFTQFVYRDGTFESFLLISRQLNEFNKPICLFRTQISCLAVSCSNHYTTLLTALV